MFRRLATVPNRSIPLAGAGLTLLLALAVLPTHFASGDLAPDIGPDPTQRAPGLLEIAPERLGPRLREIRERLELETAQLEPLRVAIREAVDPDAARAIAAQIVAVKTSTEADIVRIQLKHARAEGRDAHVAELEAMLVDRARPEVPDGEATPVRPREEARR